MTALRPLTVCTDDFGLHAGVNAAVCALVQQGRVTAVSALVDGLAWAEGVPALQAAAGQGAARRADVGLHLNLSESLAHAAAQGSAWVARSVGQLIAASYRRQLSVPALQHEIERQWQVFVRDWGRAPDFVDGHQHVHQLPQVREALMAVLDRHAAALPAHFWLRDCGTSVTRQLGAGLPVAHALKAGVISALGSSALRRLAARRGWPVSAGLLGAYPFNVDEAGYLGLWRAWLALVPPHSGLLMCHPATQPDARVADPIAAARQVECAALQGEALGQALQRSGVVVRRMGLGA